MSQVIGVTYPIPKRFVDRFFKGKDVFIKPATAWMQLKPDKVLVLSASRRHGICWRGYEVPQNVWRQNLPENRRTPTHLHCILPHHENDKYSRLQALSHVSIQGFKACGGKRSQS